MSTSTRVTSQSRKATPDQIKAVVVLRSAGRSHTVIAERAGLSISTITRILRRHKVKGGEGEQVLVAAAREQLHQYYRDDEEIQRLYSEITVDSITHIRQAREKAALAVEVMEPTDTKSAAPAFEGWPLTSL